jgi:glycosyltransferase involved in cell wall biosynthesis
MISILMPVYNGIEFIEESVSSVLHQSFEEWELLIGVNGHPENSDVYQIAKKYEEKSIKIRVFDFYTLKGKSVALNKMIEYCQYDYVAILDVDDIWIADKLEKQAPYLPNYDVIGTKCIYFWDSRFNGIAPNIPTGDISNLDFLYVNPIINSSSLIRKSLCYWNIDEFNCIEDYELWLRLRKQNHKFYNVEEILVKHRIHRASAFNSSNNQQNQLNKLKLLYS